MCKRNLFLPFRVKDIGNDRHGDLQLMRLLSGCEKRETCEPAWVRRSAVSWITTRKIASRDGLRLRQRKNHTTETSSTANARRAEWRLKMTINISCVNRKITSLPSRFIKLREIIALSCAVCHLCIPREHLVESHVINVLPVVLADWNSAIKTCQDWNCNARHTLRCNGSFWRFRFPSELETWV